MGHEVEKSGVIVMTPSATMGACTVIPDNAAPYDFRRHYYTSPGLSNDLIPLQENYQHNFRETEQIRNSRKQLSKQPQYEEDSEAKPKPVNPDEDTDVLVLDTPYVDNDLEDRAREYTDYNAVGMASWYGKEFQGKSTASGEVFNRSALTAAHPDLPFNTLVHVTNLSNGRCITVRINDRGPFSKDRIICVSEQAARKLRLSVKGLTQVKVENAEPWPGLNNAK